MNKLSIYNPNDLCLKLYTLKPQKNEKNNFTFTS